jgi:hypothetical protein
MDAGVPNTGSSRRLSTRRAKTYVSFQNRHLAAVLTKQVRDCVSFSDRAILPGPGLARRRVPHHLTVASPSLCGRGTAPDLTAPPPAPTGPCSARRAAPRGARGRRRRAGGPLQRRRPQQRHQPAPRGLVQHAGLRHRLALSDAQAGRRCGPDLLPRQREQEGTGRLLEDCGPRPQDGGEILLLRAERAWRRVGVVPRPAALARTAGALCLAPRPPRRGAAPVRARAHSLTRRSSGHRPARPGGACCPPRRTPPPRWRRRSAGSARPACTARRSSRCCSAAGS